MDEGAGQLQGGTRDLSRALEAGAAKIPSYGADDSEKISNTVSKLVGVEPVRENQVAHNRAGFSPMFISLALWVGAIAIFLVLPALDRGKKPGEAWYWTAIRPGATAALVATVQAVIAVLLTNATVGIHAVNVPGFVAMAIPASRGRFVSIVLLLLQITSIGATFPVETMPRFFSKTILILALWWGVSVAIILWAAYKRHLRRPLPYDQALLPDNIPLDEDATAEQLSARRDIKTEVLENFATSASRFRK